MSLLSLFGAILFVGVIVWLINSFTPIPSQFKTLVLVVGILIVLMIVLSAFGILGSLNVQVPRVN